MLVRPTESALVVPVPEAEPVVGKWRDRLDPACTYGVPAHVTILYPFAPPPAIDEALIEELGKMMAGFAAFDFQLTGVRWFGENVVWAAPEPTEQFVRLTELVESRWPEFPPYEGVHPEVVPHLTIAQDCPVEDMAEAAEAVAAELPIISRADRVWLMTGTSQPSSWVARAAFELS